MPAFTRKIKGKNKNGTRKNKFSIDNKRTLKSIRDTEATINRVKQKELGLDIVEYYSKMPKTMKENKYVIMGSMKRISEQLELYEEHYDFTLPELEEMRREKYESLYKLIPDHIKKDSIIVQLFLYYDPTLVASDVFPKSLRRQEFFWKTAILEDPNVFYRLDKIMQRKILNKYPEILLETTNKLDISIKGGVTIDKLPDLATRGDAMGIIMSAIFGPQIATSIAPLLTEIGKPITSALEPITSGVSALINDVGILLKLPITLTGGLLSLIAEPIGLLLSPLALL